MNENDLHQKFVMYGKNAKEWMRKCVLLLPEIEKQRVWEKKGFGSIYEYAAKLAGMGHVAVDDALRILKKIENKPLLQKVVEEKGIHAVRPVVAIVTKETEKFWAEKARTMSKNTLEVYIKEFRSLPCPGTENKTENPQQQADQSAILILNLKSVTAQKLQKLKGQRSWEELMSEFLQMREEKLTNDKPEAVVTQSRHIPAKIKKICAFAYEWAMLISWLYKII